MKMKEESEKTGLKLNIQNTKIMASSPITSWANRWGNNETVTDFIFSGSKITADGDCSHEIKRLAPWNKSYDKPRCYIKKQRHYFASEGLYSQSYDFSSSHVWIWELDHKEGWVLMNCGVGEDSWESLGLQEIKAVNTKRYQSWIFIGRTDVEAETPIFWPPDAKNWLIRKDLDVGKDWGQKEKGTTEDEMAGWHHGLDGHGFEQIPVAGDGQGGLVCWSQWGHKESDMADRLNWYFNSTYRCIHMVCLLFYLWHTQGPFMLWQMARCHLFLAESYSIVCVCVCLYITSTLSTYLPKGTFRVFLYLSYTAMNRVHISFCIISVFVFFRQIPGSGMSGLYDSSFLNTLRNLFSVFFSGCTCISVNSV